MDDPAVQTTLRRIFHQLIMRWLYTTGIFAYVFAIRAAAFTGKRKAQQWVEGRKDLLTQYRMLFMNRTEGVVWVHVSSLGEFEQGRPVIEALKQKFPEKKILLTFFSPSGYEVRKNYQHADFILYLPFDCLRLMRKFVKIVQPEMMIFVKYDFWFNLITACHEKGIPVIFISSAFRQKQFFFRWWATWFRKQLLKVDHFFVQTSESLNLLYNIGITRTTFAGDTRLDRVIALRDEQKMFPEIEQFVAGRKVLVAGSTWPTDEKFILPWIKNHSDICLIIAPHDVSEGRLNAIRSGFVEEVANYSDLSGAQQRNSKILLIDRIGVLAFIYRYAHVVYIGNGFGKGIHNILEPVVFGKPVIFGPNYRKFTEAVTLVAEGGAFSFENFQDFEKHLDRLMVDDDFHKTCTHICLDYIEKNKGATALIVEELTKKLRQ